VCAAATTPGGHPNEWVLVCKGTLGTLDCCIGDG
jgi:hypothetical protein